MKAIDTEYKGYKFRSRLEARWAVFFDTLKIPWEYEKEGYDLGDGLRYLPDFWLPKQKLWVEVRPIDGFGFDLKVSKLTEEGQRAIMICGTPHEGMYRIVLYEDGSPDFEPRYVFGLGRRTRGELWISDGEAATCFNPLDDCGKYPLTECGELTAAYGAASKARFEHGERPYLPVHEVYDDHPPFLRP